MTQSKLTTAGTGLDVPGHTPDDVMRSFNTELSLRARLTTTGMMLVALAVTAGVGSLWMTEVGLPVRTHVGFGLIVLIGLVWSVYFAGVLLRKRVLYAGHRVAAGTLAVAFGAVFLVASLALALFVSDKAQTGFLAAAFAALMLGAAIGNLILAKRRYRDLMARREELEASLGDAK